MNAQRLWQAIENKVCTHCHHFSEQKICTMKEGNHCSLKRLFTNVLNAACEIREKGFLERIPVIRQKVCRHCRNQDIRGRCVIRNNRDCALDLYADTVIETVSGLINGSAEHHPMTNDVVQGAFQPASGTH